jgi:uncharacterized protein
MKALLFTICLIGCSLFMGFQNKYGSSFENTYPRGLSHALPVSDSLPEPVGFVNDFEHLFTPDQRHVLEARIAAFEKKTTMQIAVVTINTTMTTSAAFDHYTLRLMNGWGVGQKEKNNGVLIGISSAYRKIYIRTGSGIVAKLPDHEVKRLIDTIFIPLFKQDHYYQGTQKGLDAIMQKLQ